ncbi:ComF family protein [Spirosoma luteolum]
MQSGERVLCTQCRLALPETNDHRNPQATTSINKFAGKVPIAYVLSYAHFRKGGLLQQVIHQIKYRGQQEAARELGRWYGHQLKQETSLCNEWDLLVGVPMHKSRYRQRGYNQAELIAEGLAESMDIPVGRDVLRRTHFKASQTRKSRVERWENVKTVFSVQNAAEIHQKRIVLVDDVLTTGATLEACAVELLRAGSQSVSIITLGATV